LIEYRQGKYLDKGGFLSDIKKIQDSFFYQKFSYVIRTGSNIDRWSNAFNKLIHPAGFRFFGEIAILISLINQRNSIMPGLQPGFIGQEDLPILLTLYSSLVGPTLEAQLTGDSVSSVGVLSGGYKFRATPTIIFSAPDLVDGVRSTGTAVIGQDGRLTGINITNAGSGYVNPPSIDVIGRRDRVAEFLPTLMFVFKNRDNDYKETLAERWIKLLKFYDNTAMYAYGNLHIGELNDLEEKVFTNVGTEIYPLTTVLNPTLQDTQTKIQQGYI
jgi:hypothetical protein